jgi:hypothetical protein
VVGDKGRQGGNWITRIDWSVGAPSNWYLAYKDYWKLEQLAWVQLEQLGTRTTGAQGLIGATGLSGATGSAGAQG